jgi:hypothetical protein
MPGHRTCIGLGPGDGDPLHKENKINQEYNNRAYRITTMVYAEIVLGRQKL